MITAETASAALAADVVPVTVDVLVRALRASQVAPAWYENAALLGLIGVFLGGLLTTWGNLMLRVFDVRQRAKTMKAALHGEIVALRDALLIDAAVSDQLLGTDPGALSNLAKYRTPIYAANVGNLGDLGNVEVIRAVTRFYTFLSRVNEYARRGVSGSRAHRYISGLASAADLAVLVDARLLMTGDQYVVTEDDAKDHQRMAAIKERHRTALGPQED
jgi:hypothetical protein